MDFEQWYAGNSHLCLSRKDALLVWSDLQKPKKTPQHKPQPTKPRKRKRNKRKKITYVAWIRSAAWAKFSKEMREAVGACERCGAKHNLQCHHKHYRTLGRESRKDIEVLCYHCHCKAHGVSSFN